MKTKIASLVVLMAMILSLGLSASAAVPETVSPLWNNITWCEPDLTFSSSTAYCDLYIEADSSTAKITATLTLYRINANGSRTQVATWPNLTGTGRLTTTKTFSPIVGSSTYHLVATGTVAGEAFSVYRAATS